MALHSHRNTGRAMKATTAIIAGGLVAGAADITYACVHYNLVYGTPPERIFQSVAAGLIGKDVATAGAWGTAALGLGAHMAIALIMAAAFVGVSMFVPLVRKLWSITGPLYGLGLMFLMNFIIVPMSAVGGPAQLPQGELLYGAIFAHTILVGLPIAWFAARVTR
jgi:uncharacterized membrane protein YagU involved in acid resistance